MTELLTVKTVKLTSKGQISIPKELRTGRFATNAEIAVLSFDDRIELRPLSDVAGKLTDLAQQSTKMSEKALAKRWDTPAEDRAWRDL